MDAEFPYLDSGRIHLNHSGVSPIPKRAADAMAQYAREACEEPGVASPRWFARIGEVRAGAAKLIGADAEEIAFIKSTTDGLLIVAHSINWRSGASIVVEEHTFPANWYVWKNLEALHGVRVVVWKERDCRYDLEDLRRLLRENDVQAVCVSAVDYATGWRHDLARIGELCREAGAIYCLDGIQLIGAVPIDVHAVGADFVSADSHKWMLGPEGIGILYVRRGMLDKLNDCMVGWIGRSNFSNFEARDLPPENSARRFEPGALNHAGIHGMGESIGLLNEVGMNEVWRRLFANRSALADGLGELGWRLVSPSEESHAAGIASFVHSELDAAEVASKLRERGIFCHPRRGWLRLAPHFYQDEKHMRRVVEAIAGCR